MDTTLASLPIGQLLDGRYRVHARIARGGMATVYLGQDTRLERAVALKVAHAEFASDQGFVQRFIDEARSVAKLSSPNVVAVYDQGADGNILFLAMEYVPGRTLRQLLTERGRLRPRESLDIIEGVLAGLSAAHESGIIHRDVKPENVLITPGNAVKVADFGLARAAARVGQTQDGMIIGTAAYLAPEQVAQSTSDARTDVYATGIMLFELLTGTQPYQAETPLAVAYKHVDNVVPSPSSLAPGLPPALDALVALATSRNPDRRPADAGQFLRAITEVRRGRPLAGSHAGGPSGTAQYPTGGQPTGGHHTGGHRVDDYGSGPGGSGPGGAGRGVSGLDPALTPGSMAGPLPGIGPDPRSSAVTFPPGAGPASFPLGAGPGTGSVPGAAPGGPRTDPPWAEPGTGFPSSYPYPGPAGGYPADTGSAGRGEPRHGRPAHARKVEILPAVVSGPMAAVPLGSMRPDAGPMIPAPIGTGPLGSGLMSTVPPGSPYDAMNHTLIVSGADPASGPPDGARTRRGRTPGRRYDRQREPFLQRWLFSRRLAYLAAAFAVILTVGLVTWWNTAGQYTTVPQVAGLTKSTARQELRNLGFTVRSGPGVHSNSVPRGEIVRTSPAIGARTHKGVAITIIPSLGAFRVKVPPVTGMKLADANAALRKAGLIPGPVTNATSTTIPAGVVISTHPAAGQTWPQTRPVALVQSAGQPVPNMVGEQLSEAQAQAQQLGFQLNPKDNKHSDQPAGTITSQAIRPGGPITPGEVITVRVSTGPRMVDVPNVIGLEVQQADNLMLQAGFQISINQQGLGHRVFGYSPMGQAPIGSTITLLVGFSF